MRLLVACNQCQRQYDASGRTPGTRFRCHCGAVVTVERPEGRDAAVVRCSSCGAPREEGSANCHFCGADFTLHERDLHSVCPKCLARVSDQARFCHHCGTALTPELVAGDETPLVCPVCGEPHRLTSRRIGEVTVLECDHCAGLWLGTETFKQLAERASDAIDVDQFFASARARPANLDSPEQKARGQWRYRNCVVCGNMMHRRNYGPRSGVIIDVCKDHGVWFDADELPRILDWVRSGGKAKAEEERAAQQAREERFKRATRPRAEPGALVGVPLGDCDRYEPDLLGLFLQMAIRWLFRMI
ncbi:MAG TPA: zinc ribbon domain-containing protein [Thermoguttaceae bacterium]|nr:zinc ribbon domain-containing protein [Thermoguttaceae bacterium]